MTIGFSLMLIGAAIAAYCSYLAGLERGERRGRSYAIPSIRALHMQLRDSYRRPARNWRAR